MRDQENACARWSRTAAEPYPRGMIGSRRRAAGGVDEELHRRPIAAEGGHRQREIPGGAIDGRSEQLRLRCSTVEAGIEGEIRNRCTIRCSDDTAHDARIQHREM